MIRKATSIFLVATAAMSLASPAFAQTQDRYGSSQPYYYDSTGSMVWGSWGPKEQSAKGSSQSKATARRTQSAKHARGYSAFARHH